MGSQSTFLALKLGIRIPVNVNCRLVGTGTVGSSSFSFSPPSNCLPWLVQSATHCSTIERAAVMSAEDEPKANEYGTHGKSANNCKVRIVSMSVAWKDTRRPQTAIKGKRSSGFVYV